jgi:hypothetical protein
MFLIYKYCLRLFKKTDLITTRTTCHGDLNNVRRIFYLYTKTRVILTAFIIV